MFALLTSEARSWSTVVASASRAAWPIAPLLAPWRPRSRASRSWSVAEEMVASVRPSQATPSWALRWYCWVAASESRSRIAVVVPVGESEGRLITLPVESCSCSFDIRFRPACRELSERSLSMCWVTRVMAISGSLRSG